MACTILSIDAWGNEEDGYDWNAWYRVGTVERDVLETLDTDAKLIGYMVEQGYFNERARTECQVEHDDLNIVFCDAQHCPLFAIEHGDAE